MKTQKVEQTEERIDGRRTYEFRVSDADFLAGQFKHPDKCPIARRCLRLPGVVSASILLTVAYLNFRTPSGIKSVRYVLDAAARRATRIFDDSKGERWPAGTVRFLAPTGKNTMEAKATHARARRAAGDPNQLRQYKTNGKNKPRTFRAAIYRRMLTLDRAVL
jgi:hypothetical protein